MPSSELRSATGGTDDVSFSGIVIFRPQGRQIIEAREDHGPVGELRQLGREPRPIRKARTR